MKEKNKMKKLYLTTTWCFTTALSLASLVGTIYLVLFLAQSIDHSQWVLIVFIFPLSIFGYCTIVGIKTLIRRLSR